MKEKFIIAALLLLFVAILGFYVRNESAWATRESEPQIIQQIVGLPSVAVGNLSPAARVPGL